MTELALVLLGGMLGSSHCVGMCGGFAATVGLGATGHRANLLRQILFAAGRVFTYAFLGAAAGFAGFWFARRTVELVHAQAILSVVAGLFLTVQGLVTLGWVPKLLRPKRAVGASACLAGSFLGPFFTSPHWHHVFLAGVLNGLLPCGLVYGYLALATSTASLPFGAATMAAFGAGTVPVMVLTGLGAGALAPLARRRVFRVAGLCVLITGMLAVARGYEFWHSGDPATCPGCRTASSSASPL